MRTEKQTLIIYQHNQHKECLFSRIFVFALSLILEGWGESITTQGTGREWPLKHTQVT